MVQRMEWPENRDPARSARADMLCIADDADDFGISTRYSLFLMFPRSISGPRSSMTSARRRPWLNLTSQ